MSENNEQDERENQSSTIQLKEGSLETKMLPNVLLTRLELLTNLIKDNNITDCDKTVSSDKTKAEIYLNKARSSYSNERFDDAGFYLLKAEELFRNAKSDEESLDRSNNLEETPNSEIERQGSNNLEEKPNSEMERQGSNNTEENSGIERQGSNNLEEKPNSEIEIHGSNNMEETTNSEIERQGSNNLEETPDSEIEKQDQIKRNMLKMRSELLSMQVKVSTGKIQALRTHKSLEGIEDNTEDAESYRVKAENAMSSGKCDEADENLLKAEQLYKEMAEKLFPAKTKDRESQSDEYLRIRKPIKGSDRPAVTVRGSKEDVKVCLEKAALAFDAGQLEKAKRWLEKSNRMMPTVQARELLTKVLSAIAARDAPQEAPVVESVSTPSNNQKVDKQKQLDEDEAKTYLQIAQNAMKDGNVDRADLFLVKSEKLYPLDGAKELRMELQAAKDLKKSNSQIDPKKKTSDLYVEIAEKAFRERELEKALLFAKAANNLVQSDGNNCLLADISKEIVKNKENLIKKNEHEAQECLKFAQSEYSDGCAANAELFCARAQDLFPSNEGEELLRKFQKKSSRWCSVL